MKDKFLDAKGLGHFWKRIVEYIKGTTPTKVSQLENDSHYMTNGVTSFNGSTGAVSFSETDPTVPAWAKQSTKPSYTAQEVGALPDSTVIPEGIPAGGTTGQVLRKTSNADYAVEWHDEEGGGGGGVQSDWNQSDSTKLDYIKNKPTIPAEVTESTVSGWGFTKNTGTYSKPPTGIPSTDLASSVQTSLGKADTAYQKPSTGIPSTDMSTAVQTSLSKADSAYSKPSGGIPKTDLASAVQTSLGKADTALQSYTETDPVFAASAAHGITSSDITNWNSKTSNIGTITGITMNGASKGTSGVVNLGTVITAHQDISGKVDKTTTINGKALSSNITLTASDVSALPSSTVIHEVPAGGNSGQVLKKSSATDYDYAWANQTQDYPSAYCKTAAGTAGKTAACTFWTATANTYLHLVIVYANTSASALTLNVNSTGAKAIYINGSASSSSNYTLPAGSYIIYFDGTNYYFRTDGKIQGLQPTLATQTAYTSKGTATKVPQITTNTLGQVTSITEVTITQPDITGKEDKMGILTVSATSLAPSVNKYYRFTADVGTLAVTLPTVTDTTKVASIVFYLTTDTSPNVTFTSTHSVVYQDGFQLDTSKTYEVNALFNGAAWVLMAAEINTGS